LTQVARALGLQGRYEEASALLASLPRDDAEVGVRASLETGRVINSSGDPSGARPSFEATFSAASEGGFEFLAIDALHMRAIVAAPSEQDALNVRALSLAASAGDPRARQWRGSLLNNMGWTAFERGDLEVALRLFEEALDARVEQGKPADVLVAQWCIARTLREMGRVDAALAIQLELADAHRAAGTTDAFVDEEITLLQANTTPEPGSG
jgi:tetratricopeptide (TPR) repeat protein